MQRLSVQDKSKQLVQKFLDFSNRPSLISDFSSLQNSIQILNAKECARILVNEILSNEVNFSDFTTLTNDLVVSRHYWENVLVEIDNYPLFDEK